MARRTLNQTVAQVIRNEMAVTGNTVESVAAATNISASDLESRLSSESPFYLSELANVGGFFGLRLSTLIEGARA